MATKIRHERRRCTGFDGRAECLRPIVMGGPGQTGVYFTSSFPGAAGAVRRALCWDCYDVARGNVPSGRYERSKLRKEAAT